MSTSDDMYRDALDEEEQGRHFHAFKLFYAASQLGHSDSQLMLGNYYTEGRGVDRDPAVGRDWYRTAYLNGNREAAYNLGIDFRNSGDFSEASAWLQKAVDLDDGDACVALAELCLEPAQRITLLRHAMASKPEDITEEAREQAVAMLADLEP